MVRLSIRRGYEFESQRSSSDKLEYGFIWQGYPGSGSLSGSLRHKPNGGWP